MTKRVLVVDDTLVNLRVLEALLTGAGFDVVTATNGLECLAEVERGLPDIILLDVMMPEMDGLEACRQIKRNSKTANIPIIIVTALDQIGDRSAAQEAGADGFFTKPVDGSALLARVRSLLPL